MQSSSKIYSFKIIFLSIILLVLLVAAPLALAQNGTRLTLKPVSSAEGMVTVEVQAENVSDLYGLELHLKYDPAVLEIQDSQADQGGVQIEPGTLLPVNQGFVVANQADPSQGTIMYALTLLNPAPPVNGSGPVVRMTFKILQDTPTTINVERSTLVSVNLETIPAETSPLTIGGSDDGSPVVAGSEGDNFPWWIIAAVVLGLGVLAVGGFVVMSGFRKQTQPAGDRPRGSGRRPSAFKDLA